MFPGRLKSLTHDYKRNGTTALFAAIEMAQGRIIAQCLPQHRHQEWLKFLKQIEPSVEKGLHIHIIADNYATHQHAKVQARLAKHPRVLMHFTPTSRSWLLSHTLIFPRGHDREDEAPAEPGAIGEADSHMRLGRSLALPSQLPMCGSVNLIERWFAEITREAIRPDTFRSVDELIAAIMKYVAECNADPKPLTGRSPPKSSSQKSPAPEPL